MIGRIYGILLAKQAPQLLVDVQGVAYEIDVPMTTLYALPAIGQAVTLHTHLITREDGQWLYGFADERCRRLFRALIKVNGIGPRLALTILSGISSDDLVHCVHNNDSRTLVRLPGVGKKTAERLLIDMRDRLKDWSTTTSTESAITANDAHAEAEAALLALGYKPQEAARAIAAVGSPLHNSEELIRLALQNSVQR